MVTVPAQCNDRSRPLTNDKAVMLNQTHSGLSVILTSLIGLCRSKLTAQLNNINDILLTVNFLNKCGMNIAFVICDQNCNYYFRALLEYGFNTHH